MIHLLVGLIAIALQSDVVAVEPHKPIHNFLKGAEARRGCAPATGGEVVVCGRPDGDEAFRLRPLPDADRYREEPLRAEAQVLGEGTLRLHNEDVDVGGVHSKRAMVTLSLPF